MAAPIKHKGEVIRIEGKRIDVKMTVESACASCRAKSVCGMDESQERVVSVTDAALSREVSVGEEVVVAITEEVGIKAVAYSYLLPLLVLTVVMVATTMMGLGEGIAALSSIGACAVYYVVLYLLRRRVEREIKFKIEKLTD